MEAEPIGAEPLKARFARAREAPAGRVMRVRLADKKQLVAPIAGRFADQALGRTVAVHLGRIDQLHSEVHADVQRGDLPGTPIVALPHHPSALTKCG